MQRSRKSVCFIGLGLAVFATGCPIVKDDTTPPCPNSEKRIGDDQRDNEDNAIRDTQSVRAADGDAQNS